MSIFGNKDRPQTADGPALSPEQESFLIEARERLEAIEERADVVAEVLEAIDGRLKELTLAIDEGIERVDRSERRVRAVVQRAQRRLADEGAYDAGLEAEAQSLRPRDGEASAARGVQPVFEGLEQSEVGFDASGLPGRFSADLLRFTTLEGE